MPYPQTGYSWFGMGPEKKRKPLTADQKIRINEDCKEMQQEIVLLEDKVNHYHFLCKKYERFAGTNKGEELFKEIEALKNEIDQITKQLHNSLDDSISTVRFPPR